MFYLFANWKSHKNLTQAREWFNAFRDAMQPETAKALTDGSLSVVVFPPAPLLYPLHTLCSDMPGMSVGIQDVSPYGEGKQTGLVNASSAEGIAKYGIVGHVEERKRGDTPEIVAQKYQELQAHHISPILCITSQSEMVAGASIVSYEPANAIGNGQNAVSSDVQKFKNELNPVPPLFIYGGSVDAGNCAQYLAPLLVNGFLVGTASLQALSFAALADTCTSYVAK